MSSGISVVMNTLNAQEWLEFSLRSVRSWVDEIVVVDMHSEDRTVEIALSHGARVLTHERSGYVEPARAFAVGQATGPWVLILDADELVPAPLSRTLCEIVAADQHQAARISRLNYFFGSPMRYAGWGLTTERHLRFFKRGAVEFSDRIHEPTRPSPGTTVADLPARAELSILHFNYLDTSQFIERLNRYTTVEAKTWLERGNSIRAVSAVGQALRELGARYLRFGGFRDGWRGAFVSLAMLFYRVAAYAKWRELSTAGPREQVVERYRKEAERLLSEYP